LEIELSFYVGIIKPRSGLAFNYGIDVLAGVIDADYKDEIKVILINHGDDPYHIKAGDRIAQLVVLPYYVINGEDGNAPIRSGGFGSTGN
jgi:dUTP pyrophosphatase